jgi:acetate kinase
MAFTLVINPGSSSKKFALYKDTTLLIDAYVERSRDGFEMCTAVSGMQQRCELLPKSSYAESLRLFLDLAEERTELESKDAVVTIALRVVAPGTYFQHHRIVDTTYIESLTKAISSAPLHIPHVMQEILAVRSFLPHATIVAVSDSAFHVSLPRVARQYSLPAAEMRNADIYHFGYHGISVASVMRRAANFSKRSMSRVIVCHIGSGVSITAIQDGKSIDTTMGYAPGSGLIMGSRSGDVPADALLALMSAKNLSPNEARNYLQTEGGLLAIGGESDLRLLLEGRARGEVAATEAIESFVYTIKKAIGSYVAILGGVDSLIFTATAGERSSILRALITEGLGALGITIDAEKNDECVSRDTCISSASAPTEVLVIKTNEAEELLLVSQLIVDRAGL